MMSVVNGYKVEEVFMTSVWRLYFAGLYFREFRANLKAFAKLFQLTQRHNHASAPRPRLDSPIIKKDVAITA